MVKIGPFEVELVEAETGRRFTEHSPSELGRTYFESEPDAEYFISVQKIAYTPGPVGFRFRIDGQALCGEYHLGSLLAQDKYGLLQIKEGMRYHKALKFVKPPRGHNFQEYNNNNGEDGKIVMEVFEFQLQAPTTRASSSSSYLQDGTVNVRTKLDKAWRDGGIAPGVDDSKYVCSAEGRAATHKQMHVQTKWIYGRQLGAYTMYYCSAQKLVALGVLPRPPPPSWSNGSARRRPAATATASAVVSPCSSSSSPTALVERHPKRIRVENSTLGLLHEYDLFDLTGEHSDDDDE